MTNLPLTFASEIGTIIMLQDADSFSYISSTMNDDRQEDGDNQPREDVAGTADGLDASSVAGAHPTEYDSLVWDDLVAQHGAKLKRMVHFRMNPKLRGRVDASDVVQETFIEAARVMEQTKTNPDMPVHLWLRRLANQKLIQAHRKHIGAACRDAGREQRKHDEAMASSYSIARYLVGNVTSPSNAAIRDEKRLQLELALDQMEPLDREVLTLRHFEQLSGPESAEILEVSHDVIKKRYIRALEKLQRIMSNSAMLE